MNLASIDIGTNSTRLLITRLEKGVFTPLARLTEITRLGKGIKETGNIKDENAKLTIDVLLRYKSLIDSFHAEKFRAVGTSALRRAGNSNDFIYSVFKETGIKADIVSGEEEARFSFTGAVKSMIIAGKRIGAAENILVVDIGGGSSEFIFGKSDLKFFKTQSINIGCVRATEEFLKSDPPAEDEILSLRSYVREKLKKELFNYCESQSEEFIVLGLAGTISALAGISIGLKEYKMEKLNYLILDLKTIRNIFEKLCRLNLKKRKKISGLDPKRADIIIGGAVIVLEVMAFFGKNVITVSENDILDGIIYSLVNF